MTSLFKRTIWSADSQVTLFDSLYFTPRLRFATIFVNIVLCFTLVSLHCRICDEFHNGKVIADYFIRNNAYLTAYGSAETGETSLRNIFTVG